MSLAEELRKLADLHAAGALSDEEFAAAKSQAIERDQAPPAAATDPRVLEQLDSLRVANSIQMIDRQWEHEREQYLVAGKYGHRYEPSYFHAGLVAVVGLIGGGMFLGFSTSMDGFGEAASFAAGPAVLFIAISFCIAGYVAYQASQLEAARVRYQRRRADAAKSRSSFGDRRDDDQEGIRIVP